MAADQDAWLELATNVGVAPVVDRDTWLELAANVGFPVTIPEPGSAFTEIVINVGVELPPTVTIERPQSGWGVPCVPSSSATFFPDDTKSYADIVVEAIA